MQADPLAFIVDDDDDVRQSLEWLFASVQLKTQSFSTPQAFLAEYRDETASCLVTDVRMPGMSGLDLQQALKAQGHQLPVIVMTGYGDVATAVKAMKFGALDFIEKPFNNQAMLDLVNRALLLDAQRRAQDAEAQGVSARSALLSPQERRVMVLVVAGQSNKQIAQELAISVKTVEVHRSRMMQKMQASSIADLVRVSTML